MRAFLLAVVFLVGCGAGSSSKLVSFYGDSITAGRTQDIALGRFNTQDFAYPGNTSHTPLHPEDRASIVVLRYGMADTVFGIAPEQTRRNLLQLVEQVRQQGKIPVVVSISKADGREVPTNEAIKDLITVDLSDIEGSTVDGIHPTDAYHAAMYTKIRNYLEKL